MRILSIIWMWIWWVGVVIYIFMSNSSIDNTYSSRYRRRLENKKVLCTKMDGVIDDNDCVFTLLDSEWIPYEERIFLPSLKKK